jgi:hypothetical protein
MTPRGRGDGRPDHWYITVPGRQPLNLTFSREEVEDSWNRLDRNDVRHKIAAIVEKTTKL